MPLTLPPEFINRIKQQTHFEAFFQALNEPKITSIRLNPFKNVELDFVLDKKVAFAAHGYYLHERPSFIHDPLWHAGAYYVQEASSMLIEQALMPLINTKNALKILDLCAAPGGKSTHILSLIPQHHLLVANETIKSRTVLLKDNLVKWGCTNVYITQNDPKDFQKLPDFFDIILVDAPCSGEGLFRKDPDSIAEWNENAVNVCADRQNRIIHDVLPALKTGGHIIYSTCTYSPQENELNIEKWTKDLPLSYTPLPTLNLYDKEIENTGLGYRCWPHKTKGEGFFLACLQKNNDIPLPTKGKETFFKKNRREILPKKFTQQLNYWLAKPEDYQYYLQNNNEITAVPLPYVNSNIHTGIDNNLKVFYGPLNVGKWLGTEIIPSHELSLSAELNPHLPRVELSKLECHTFLKKENVSTFESLKNIADGWHLITYKCLPIGWIKKIGHRANNYFPKEIRVLT